MTPSGGLAQALAVLLVSFMVAEAQMVTHTCELGWQLKGAKCFKKMEDEKKFFPAKRSCIKQGGFLAVVQSEVLSRWLDETFFKVDGSPAFIGATFLGSGEGTVQWFEAENDNLNDPDTLNLFAEGEPADLQTGSINYCIAFKHGWRTRRCDKKSHFICEKEATPHHPAIQPAIHHPDPVYPEPHVVVDPVPMIVDPVEPLEIFDPVRPIPVFGGEHVVEEHVVAVDPLPPQHHIHTQSHISPLAAYNHEVEEHEEAEEAEEEAEIVHDVMDVNDRYGR